MIFYQLPFWNNIYLKDIILWLIFSGISYCVNSIIKGDTEHLKSTVKDNFIFENICPSCGNKGRYIATDMRPVFPEENVLISLILGDNPQKYQESSVWFGSGMYIIDGKKVRLSITKLNSLPLDKIHKLKEKYEACLNRLVILIKTWEIKDLEKFLY